MDRVIPEGLLPLVEARVTTARHRREPRISVEAVAVEVATATVVQAVAESSSLGTQSRKRKKCHIQKMLTRLALRTGSCGKSS